MNDYRALAGLFVAFVAAILIASARPPRSPDRGTARIGLLTIALQTAHFLEELSTGFYVRFPELVGVDPMTREFFVAFNAAWILLWLAALAVVKKAPFLAGTLLWFLAIAAIGNAVAHPAAALFVGGYFPGLVTAPVLGVAGLFFAASLWRAGSTKA